MSKVSDRGLRQLGPVKAPDRSGHVWYRKWGKQTRDKTTSKPPLINSPHKRGRKRKITLPKLECLAKPVVDDEPV